MPVFTRVDGKQSPEAIALANHGRVVQAKKREQRKASLTLAGTAAGLVAMRAQAAGQMLALLEKTKRAIDKLPADRAADHRALAATLIALSQRIDEALDRLGGGGEHAESYEARLARAYSERGLPVPGRLARAARAQAQAGETPSPASPARMVEERWVTPSLEKSTEKNETEEE